MTLADAMCIFGLLCLLLAVWTSRKALQMNRKAAFWQQQAGENARDALRWKLHLQDCARGGKTAAQRQRIPVLAMAQRLREGR